MKESYRKKECFPSFLLEREWRELFLSLQRVAVHHDKHGDFFEVEEPLLLVF